jgi:hypothetical protein
MSYNWGNERQRDCRFTVEGTAAYATQWFCCAEERLRSVSATGKTPYSNSAGLWADVARLAFCLRHLPIWASFRKKIIEDAMTRNILQEESCKSSNKLSHHPIMIELPLTKYSDP